jgi:hypothetical protein
VRSLRTSLAAIKKPFPSAGKRLTINLMIYFTVSYAGIIQFRFKGYDLRLND